MHQKFMLNGSHREKYKSTLAEKKITCSCADGLIKQEGHAYLVVCDLDHFSKNNRMREETLAPKDTLNFPIIRA